MVVRRSKIIKRLLLCRNVLLHMVAISLVARLKRVIKGYETIGIFITFYNPFNLIASGEIGLLLRRTRQNDNLLRCFT